MPDISVSSVRAVPFQMVRFSEGETTGSGTVEIYRWHEIDSAERQPERRMENNFLPLDIPGGEPDAGFVSSAESVSGGRAKMIAAVRGADAAEADARAEELIAGAEREAGEILLRAREEADELRESAKKSGHALGYEEGLVAGKERAEAEQQTILQQTLQYYLEDIRAAADALGQEKDQILERHLAELRDLTVAIAEKVINVSLQSSGQVIEKMIVSATERMKNKQWAKISISRYDAELMIEGDMDIISAMQHISDNVKVVVMENADPGTCIVEFPDQIIDASVKTQLDSIREMLRSEGN